MTVARDGRVVVVGQGYVGLPLAVRAVEVGHAVVGFDLDKDRVDRLRRGESFIDDITDADLAAAVHSGRYTPSDEPADLAGFTVAVVCVPVSAPKCGNVVDTAQSRAGTIETKCTASVSPGSAPSMWNGPVTGLR